MLTTPGPAHWCGSANGKKLVAQPGRSSRCETERTKALKQMVRDPVSRTEHAPRSSQRLAEELLRLCLLAALREGACEVARRVQRLLVLRAEQAGPLDEDLTLDLRGLGVLALS